MRRPKDWFWFLATLSVALYLCFIFRTGFVVGDQLCFSLFDDAMVSMRYARNLVEGHGFVFNPGEERVEGYSNLLWTLWMAALHLLPVTACEVSRLVMLSGAGILVANLWVVRKILECVRVGQDRATPLLGLVLVALCYPLVFWTLRGMEVGLLSLGLSLSVWCAIQLENHGSSRWLHAMGVCFAVLLLSRDDTLLPVLLIGAYAVLKIDRRRRVQCAILIAASILVSKSGHACFRYAYYGDVLPNTYYLKLTGLSFQDRAGRGAAALFNTTLRSLLPWLAGAGMYFYEYWKRGLSRRVGLGPCLFLAVFLIQALYSVYVGGDAWEWMNYSNRYVTVALPLFILPTVLYLELILTSPRSFLVGLARLVALFGVGAIYSAAWDMIQQADLSRTSWLSWNLAAVLLVCGLVTVGSCWAGLVVARRLSAEIGPSTTTEGKSGTFKVLVWLSMTLLVILMVGQQWVRWARFNAFGLESDIRVARLGLFLKDRTDPDVRVAVLFAGATPYFSGRSSVDLLGKNDRVVARLPAAGTFPGHNKMDLDYSIGRLQPEVVVHLWGPGNALVPNIENLGYRRLPNGIWLRQGGRLVDASRLGEAGFF